MKVRNAESISVVVPARNAAGTIARCVDSLRALEPPALEVIVVDDASTDATAEIAAAHGARVVRVPANVGPGLARNLGVEAAGGRFVAFTDADCEAPRGWLEGCLRGMDGTVCGVSGPYSGASHDNLVTRLMDACLRYRQQDMPDTLESCITANLLVERSEFLAVGGFPAYRLPGAAVCCFTNEDEELAFLLARHTGRPLRWLRDNGVLHAYRATFRGYFRQQAKYAEAILLSYARFPAMLSGRTNYSRGGGVTQVLAVWLLIAALAAAALLPSPLALLGAVPFLAADAGAALAMSARIGRSTGRSTGRKTGRKTGRARAGLLAVSYAFLGLTALAWSKGLATGACKAAVGLLSPSFKGTVAWRPEGC